MLTSTLAERFAAIGINRDYADLDLAAVVPDLQGWASDSACFAELISELQPSLVIEVGTWKGASLIQMASSAMALGLETQFICVDTWLGSNAVLWLQDGLRASLQLQGGFPTMFRTFARNLQDAGLVDRVFPMPMPSATAFEILWDWQVKADLIYIDADHTKIGVYRDLLDYTKLLRPGGILLGDDYLPEWPGVVAAADAFSHQRGLRLERRGEKFLIRMP
jgi:predicted O-methyltransferase YrrM